MKICIAGGQSKALFLIELFKQEGHKVTVINDDEKYADVLSRKFNMPIIFGNPTTKRCLEEAEIENYDILVALRPIDSDNLAICQMARKTFHVRRAVAVVSDPANVEIFTALGVQTTISATYQVSKIIEQASLVENIVNTLDIQNENIKMTNILIKEEFPVSGHSLLEIAAPLYMSVSCVIRGEGFIIPRGDTKIEADDRLLIITDAAHQSAAIDFITGGL